MTEINKTPTDDRRLNRRRFLRFGFYGSCLSAFGWAKWFEPHWLQVSEHSLVIPNLPVGLEGKRLVQISDLHIGSTDEDYLLSVMSAVNDLEADILVLTGDIIDRSFPDCGKVVSRIMSTLQLGKIATLGSLGNHDYGSGWSQTGVADEVVDSVSDLGIEILRNRKVQVEGLSVFGLEDYWSPNFEAADVLEGAVESEPALCLCHNPDVCDLPVWGQFQGVILSGHTHGGQCKPPFLAPPRLPVQNRHYVSGFYDVGISRTLYINRGVGYGFKARFNCRPEVTVFGLSAGAG